MTEMASSSLSFILTHLSQQCAYPFIQQTPTENRSCTADGAAGHVLPEYRACVQRGPCQTTHHHSDTGRESDIEGTSSFALLVKRVS